MLLWHGLTVNRWRDGSKPVFETEYRLLLTRSLQIAEITGKMRIGYGAAFMPCLPRRQGKDGKPCRLTRRCLYTVLRLFWQTSKTASVEITVHCRLCTSFFPPHTVVNTVFWDYTVVPSISMPSLSIDGVHEGHCHRLLATIDRNCAIIIARIVSSLPLENYYWRNNNDQTVNNECEVIPEKTKLVIIYNKINVQLMFDWSDFGFRQNKWIIFLSESTMCM